MSQFTIGVCFAITTGLCWAVLAIILKYALRFTSPGTIVWFRMLCAFTAMLTYYVVRKPQVLKKIFTQAPSALTLAALFLALNYFGYLNGLSFTSASNAQIVTQLGPLLLALIGVFYFKESMILAQWIGVAMAIIGFTLFDWDQAVLAQTHLSRTGLHAYLTGTAWIVGGGIAWALFAAIQKNIIGGPHKRLNPQEANLFIYMICALVLIPLARFHELSPFRPGALTPWQWFILVALGLNTVVAYGSFAEAMNRIPASYVSLIITINPLVTILLVTLIGALGLHFISPEPIHWRGYLGATLVVAGVATTVSLRGQKK